MEIINLSDEIHQSCFDLCYYENQKDEFDTVFIKYLKYLEHDITIEEEGKIIFLINRIISIDTDHFFPIFSEIIEKSSFNANQIIITSYILETVNETFVEDSTQFQINIFFKNYQNFIKNCMNDILSHFNAINQDLIVLNQKIPDNFKFEFIFNIVSLLDINDQIVSEIGKFLSVVKKCSYCMGFTIFILKIIDIDLFHILAVPIISNKCLHSIVTIDDLKRCIENLSNSLFIQYFEQIQEYFISAEYLNAPFVTVLLQRCFELHLKLNSIEKIFYYISMNDITPQILEYLKEYDFLLPEELVSNFIDLPDKQFLIKIIPTFELIPNHLHEMALNETIDVNFYNRIFKTEKIESPVFSTNKFYVHIYKNNYECSKKTIKHISKICQISFENDKFNKTIDDIIFSSYPPNQQQIKFLSTFFKYFDKQHTDLFNNYDHMKCLINEIININAIPLYSFFEIINYDYILALLKKGLLLYQKKSYLLYYIFKFSRKDKKYGKEQIYLKVYNTNLIDNQDFIDFIIHNDKNILTKLDEKSLLLAVNALIYGEYQNIGNITGLTKETILPFFAIVLKNWTKSKVPSMKIFPKEILDLFMSSFKLMLNNDSPLIKASIDSILNSDMGNTSLLNLAHLKESIMGILIESLLKNEYCADKTTILSYLIGNSNLFRNVKFDFTHFFSYLFKHLHETNYQTIKYKINFNYLKNIKDILTLFTKQLQDSNSSESEIINSLYLLTNLSTNVPKISIDDTTNLKKVLINENIANKHMIFYGFDKVFIIPSEFSQYIKDYMKNYDDFIDAPNLDENINDIEAKNILHLILTCNDLKKIDIQLNNLFKRMMNNKSMAKRYFQILFQQIDYQKVDQYQLKIIFQNEYNDYEGVFDESIHLISKSINYYGSELEIAILSNLFKLIEMDKSKYQAFLCLRSIACTFTFLFETRTEQIFETVLSELDNFVLLFEKRNEQESEMKIQNAISAFSFLISTLHSPIIMDEFIIWLLNDFERFSDSAIYCFNFIIYSVLKESRLNHSMALALMKYDFNQKILSIMRRDIKEGIWKTNYFYMIYLLLNEFYNSSNAGIIKLRYIFTDEFKKNVTFTPFIINQITENELVDLPKTHSNNNILNFLKYINKNKHFWINYKRKSETIQKFYLEDNIQDKNDKICKSNYLNNQNVLFQILQYNTLHSDNDLVFSQLCLLIQTISQNKNYLQIFLNLIEKDLDTINDFKTLEDILKLLLELANLDVFQSSLNDSFMHKLTNICLRLDFIEDDKILHKISDLLITLEKVPNNSIHILGFLFLFSDEFIQNENISRAFQLSSKFNADQLLCLQKVIESSFYDSINNENHTLNNIHNYLNIVHLIPQYHYNDYLKFLENKFEIYDPTENIDITLVNVLIKLTNLLTPKRNITDDSQVEYQSIPQYVKDLNPNFWEVFILNRNKIEDIMQRFPNISSSMNILLEYPEFFSFSIRYSIFQSKISKIDTNHQIIFLHIDEKNILESSISQLDDLELVLWKNSMFKIKYIDSIGQDEGGITKDWFTKLIKELLNSQNGLFQISDQMSYHPNYLSFANPDHLKYFTFAGRIIAKALLQGIAVDAHFSRSFLLQILNRKVMLKDFKDTDESLFNSLEQINENNDEQYFKDIDLYFEQDSEEYGIYKTVELKENGSQIQLTHENKNEYIDLMVDYHSRKRIIEQIKAFCDGFYSLMSYENIKMFTSNEFDKIICGLPKIDVEDMKKHIYIESPYTKDSQIVKLFFDSISKWNQENLSKLIYFMTGSPKVPVIGFQFYNDIGYPIRIVITQNSPQGRFPVAHTCFNILDLPEYETEKELNDKLLMAINVDTFDII